MHHVGQEHRKTRQEEDADRCWRVGTEGTVIKVEDLVLLSLHHVSMGSWQPQLKLRQQPHPFRMVGH